MRFSHFSQSAKRYLPFWLGGLRAALPTIDRYLKLRFGVTYIKWTGPELNRRHLDFQSSASHALGTLASCLKCTQDAIVTVFMGLSGLRPCLGQPGCNIPCFVVQTWYMIQTGGPHMTTRPGVRPDPRGNGRWQVRFRVNGRQYTKVADSKRDADRRMDAIEERKALVISRKIAIPDDVDVGEWFFTDGQGGARVAPRGDAPGDVADLIDAYLESRRLDVAAGQLSHSSYDSDKNRLADFQKLCRRRKVHDLPTAIGSATLGAYRTYVMGRLAREELKAVSVKHALRTVKAVLLWAYKSEKVDALPRVLDGYAKIAIPAPSPKFFSTDEIKRLYDTADGRMKLVILLALNCGYTQMDIATLEHSHVDWSTGMIVRSRSKTGQPQEHRLWARTLGLLKEQATAPEESSLVLLAKRGRPLVHATIKADGTPTKTDSISQAFSRLKKAVNEGRKKSEPEIKLPFKCFRKTGADQIAKQYQQNPLLVDLYLAHTQTGMKKHYARQHYDELHKATDWLATVFGFESEDNASSGGSP